MRPIGRVLVVDDEFGVRQSFQMVLKDTYDVLLADSGKTAIDLLKCATNPNAPALARSVYIKDASAKRRLCFIQAGFGRNGGETYVSVADISEEVTCELLGASDSQQPSVFHGIVGKDDQIRYRRRLRIDPGAQVQSGHDHVPGPIVDQQRGVLGI